MSALHRAIEKAAVRGNGHAIAAERRAALYVLRKRGWSWSRLSALSGMTRAGVIKAVRAHCDFVGASWPDVRPQHRPAPVPIKTELSPAELRVFNAIADAINGMSSRDLLQFLYPDGRMPASAVDCVRSAVARIRSKLPHGVRVISVLPPRSRSAGIPGRYFVRTRMAEAAE